MHKLQAVVAAKESERERNGNLHFKSEPIPGFHALEKGPCRERMEMECASSRQKERKRRAPASR